MKFLMTYQQNPKAAPPTAEHMAKIGEFAMKHMQSGVLKMTGGLVRPSKGIQLECKSGKASVIDGPFIESKELIDGFALVETKTRDEAVRIACDFMELAGDGKGEILQVFDQGEGQPS